MTRKIVLLAALAALLLSGCYDEQIDALTGEITATGADLDSESAGLQATIDELQATVDLLEARLAAVEAQGDHGAAGYLTQVAFAATVAGGIEEEDVQAWDGVVAEVEGSSDGIGDSRVDLLEEDAGDLESDVGALQSDVGSLQTDVDGLQTDLGTVQGDVTSLESDKLGRISSDLTLAVPADYADINEALAWLDGYSIDGGTTVEIELAPGTYSFSEEVVVRHPDGDRIHIVGDPGDPATITFPYSDGFVVAGSSALGLLADLTLVGSVDDYTGLLVADSSAVLVGDLTLQNWGGSGVHVTGNSALEAAQDGLVTISTCHVGALVDASSFADLSDAVVSQNTWVGLWSDGGSLVADGANSSGNAASGFYASGGGTLSALNTTSSGNTTYGYYTVSGSVTLADGATAEDNGEDGFHVRGGSYLHAPGAQSNYNDDDGFEANIGAVLYASGSSTTGDSNSNMGYVSVAHSLVYATSSTSLGQPDVDYWSAYNGYVLVNGALGDEGHSASHLDLTDLVYAP